MGGNARTKRMRPSWKMMMTRREIVRWHCFGAKLIQKPSTWPRVRLERAKEVAVERDKLVAAAVAVAVAGRGGRMDVVGCEESGRRSRDAGRHVKRRTLR